LLRPKGRLTFLGRPLRSEPGFALRATLGEMPVNKMRLAALAAGAMLLAACGPRNSRPGTAEVYVADVIQRDVPIYMEVVGQTKGSQTSRSGRAWRAI